MNYPGTIDRGFTVFYAKMQSHQKHYIHYKIDDKGGAKPSE
jgi:hypothetical protein